MLTDSDFRQIGEIVREIMSDMISDDFPLTRQQAAYYLGVSGTTIDNYVKKGLLKQICRHGMLGYEKSELHKLKK